MDEEAFVVFGCIKGLRNGRNLASPWIQLSNLDKKIGLGFTERGSSSVFS